MGEGRGVWFQLGNRTPERKVIFAWVRAGWGCGVRGRSYLSGARKRSADLRRYSVYKVPITEFTDRVIYRLLNFRS